MRNPLKGHQIEKLQEYLVTARFKIIELLQVLRSDYVLSKKVVDPEPKKKEAVVAAIAPKGFYFQKKMPQ